MNKNIKNYIKGCMMITTISILHLLNTISSMKSYSNQLFSEIQIEQNLELFAKLNSRYNSLYMMIFANLTILIASVYYYRLDK